MLYFGEQELAAILLSLKVAIWATFLSLPFAVWVAFLLVRRRFWGREVLNALVHLPLILPPVVTGYLLLMFFGRVGFAGQILNDYFGITIAFQWTGAVLAAAIMAFPLVVRAVRVRAQRVGDGTGAVVADVVQRLRSEPRWLDHEVVVGNVNGVGHRPQDVRFVHEPRHQPKRSLEVAVETVDRESLQLVVPRE